MLDELVEVAVLLREVEEARFREGPKALVARMRARGVAVAPRTARGRRWLARVIFRMDTLMHGESNCYRRSLVRVALDREAALEPFVLGLDVRETQAAAKATGHAWTEGTETGHAFDVEFVL